MNYGVYGILTDYIQQKGKGVGVGVDKGKGKAKAVIIRQDDIISKNVCNEYCASRV